MVLAALLAPATRAVGRSTDTFAGQSRRGDARSAHDVFDFMTSVQVDDVQANAATMDVTGALQSAITAAAASRKRLVVRAGSYRLSDRLTGVVDAGINIAGEGSSVTRLIWDADSTGRGLDLAYTDVRRPPQVSGMSLQTKARAAGTALKITGPQARSVTYKGPMITDMTFGGVTPGTHCWDIGAEFDTCWYVAMTDFSVKGLDSTTEPFVQTAGVKLTGCQVCFFDRFTVFHVATGLVEAAGKGPTHGEGFSFGNFEIVGVSTGISLGGEGVAPGTNIGPGHINAYTRGLVLDKRYQTAVHDLLVYKTHLSTSNFVGVAMNDCDSCNVHNNTIQGSAFAKGDTHGIQLSGELCSGNQIAHNTFANFAGSSRVGITVGSGSSKNLVIGNTCSDGTVQPLVLVSPDAKNNTIGDNHPTTER
jgi:hypothetical protein